MKLLITPNIFIMFGLDRNYFNYLNTRFELVLFPENEISTKEKFIELVEGCFGILTSSEECIDEDIIRAAGTTLKVICVSGAGYEKLDINAVKKYGIRLGTAGQAVTEATSELAVTLLLSASRRLNFLENEYRKNTLSMPDLRKGMSLGRGLEDGTIGILGGGRIGTAIAKKLSNFSIGELLYWSRSTKPAIESLGGKMCTLNEIASRSDFLIISLAYTNNTHHIINEKILSIMKETAILINVSRGGLIDQDALIKALEEKKISGAALDVTTPEPLPSNHPLLKLDNLILLPHIGGLTSVSLKKRMKLCWDNLMAVAENRAMPEEILL